MTEDNHNGKAQRDEQNRDDPQWEHFKDVVRRIAQVPKEELDEKLAEEKREKKERRAG